MGKAIPFLQQTVKIRVRYLKIVKFGLIENKDRFQTAFDCILPVTDLFLHEPKICGWAWVMSGLWQHLTINVYDIHLIVGKLPTCKMQIGTGQINIITIPPTLLHPMIYPMMLWLLTGGT